MTRVTSTIVLLLLTLCSIVIGVKDGEDAFRLSVPIPISKTGLSAWDVYLPTANEVNGSCRVALEYLKDDLQRDKLNGAHKLVDSWGATGVSFLIGVPFFLGTYDECEESRYHDDEIHGRYCKVKVRKILSKDEKSFSESPIPRPPYESQKTILDVLDSQLLPNRAPVVYGTCIPDTCSRDDMEVSLIETFNSTDFVVSEVNCHHDYRYDTFSTEDIVFVVTLGVFAFLLLSASIVDIHIKRTKRKDLAKGGLRYLLPFSAYTNIKKLFHMNTEKAPGMITCLHGIRVLSMTWVVYGHQQSLPYRYQYNLFTMFDKMRGLLYQTSFNAFPSVDTFFFISGFLMAYNVLKEFKKTKKFNLPLFYFHRLLRLVPPIALVAGFFATIPVYFLNGPIVHGWDSWRRDCQAGWWRDALFLDNFAQTNHKPYCLGQAWYIAVDSQLYLLAPLVLVPLLYVRQIGMVWLYCLTVASMVIPGVITYINDLPPTNLVLDLKTDVLFNKVYLMPWCRAGPVFIGIWLGVFLHDQGNKRIRMKPWQVLTGWTVAAVSGIMVVYGLWSYNIAPRKAHYDVMTQILYAATQRQVWSAAVGWVVFACHNGYGGLVDVFLSHPIWQPMSRLTYAMFLISMPLQFLIYYNARNPYYFSHYNMIIETVGALILSVIPSVLVSLTVESPIIGIEKLIFKRPSRRDEAPKKEVNGVDNDAFGDDMKELEHIGVIREEDKANEEITTNI